MPTPVHVKSQTVQGNVSGSKVQDKDSVFERYNESLI